MLENYITPSKDTVSRSGLYWNGLPGVSFDLYPSLAKEEHADWEEWAADIYQRMIINFVGQVQARLADKFFVDLKLVSRETSKFADNINSSALQSGIKINYRLPKYGKTQVVSVEVFSDTDQTGFEFEFRDKDENGRLLKTVTTDLVTGINTINIDTYFSVDELFISYDANLFDLRETTNKFYNDFLLFDDLSCSFPCWNNSVGTINHVNGGGFNVFFNSVCSIDKVIEQNINIFKEAFWYSNGLELMHERIHSDRFNRWTTLTTERAAELIKDYEFWVDEKLTNAIKSLRMNEDRVCFSCKSTVYHSYQLP
jgi:hypothetical protein